MDSDIALRVQTQIEATIFEPLFEPLESAMGPVASLAFEPMLVKLLERARG